MLNKLRKIYNPPVFQGSLTKKGYFEGWYLKHVSADRKLAMSFIPGISLANEPHAFIQTIDGMTGKTNYFRFPITDFSYNKRQFDISIGNNRFSDKGIVLDIDQYGQRFKGEMHYSGLTPYQSTGYGPGIMGWYSFVPFLECYHGVVSVNHQIEGSIAINNHTMDYSGGKGYIEKDWGTSFPACWIWLQTNSFVKPNVSFMCSVAKIPWLGSYFVGFICFLYIDGTYYRFLTYNGSKIEQLEQRNSEVEITFVNNQFQLKVVAHQKQRGNLAAPTPDGMDRVIKESIDSDVTITLAKRNGKVIFYETCDRAGLELVGDVQGLLKT